MTTTTTKQFTQDASNVANQAADSASATIRSAQSATDTAFNKLSDKVQDAKDSAAPLISRLSNQADAALRKGTDAVRETSAQLRERALMASDATVGYIKDEPVKAMLIAAATGAALMALVGLLSRSRGRD
jgi:ElaB/YqjD/DUF883 family membrane-anchored ribosome-binding protein